MTRGVKFEQRFWAPALTATYPICPIPFKVDTYKGCVYNCAYCFARDLTNFHRRKRTKAFSSKLTVNDPVKFLQWFKGNYGRRDDPHKPDRVALNMRMPLKIGILADPCPPIERNYRVTEKFLRVLHLADYPVHLQTKNPGILAEILGRLGEGHNVCVSVTLISMDEEWCMKVEPGAPSPKNRLEGMQRIVDLGYPVFGRVQPAVYTVVLEQLPRLVPAFAEAGVWGFNTEGLKVRMAMPPYEQEIWESSPLRGTRTFYKARGTLAGADYVLSDAMKLEYIELAESLAAKHGLSYYSADNSPMGYGCGFECCGTEKLRDYTPFRYNLRSHAFGVMDDGDRLAACLANFTRQEKKGTVKQDIDQQLRER